VITDIGAQVAFHAACVRRSLSDDSASPGGQRLQQREAAAALGWAQ
jgi:hypothetical protein